MKTIYKYEIETRDRFTLDLPTGATILTVNEQQGGIYLWAEVDPDVRTFKPRLIEIFGTGHEIREDMGITRQYLGTTFVGRYVWHVYENTSGF